MWIDQSRIAEGGGGNGAYGDGVFRADRFDVSGAAIGPSGSPTDRLACPFCRCGVPRAFFEHRPFFIAVFGGKVEGSPPFLEAAIRALQSPETGYLVTILGRGPAPRASQTTQAARASRDSATEETNEPSESLGVLAAEARARRGGQSSIPFECLIKAARRSEREERRCATRVVSVREWDGNPFDSVDRGGNAELLHHVGIADLVIFCFDPTAEGDVSAAGTLTPSATRQRILPQDQLHACRRFNAPPRKCPLCVVVMNADRWLLRDQGGDGGLDASRRCAWVEAWRAGNKSPDVVANVSIGVRELLAMHDPQLVAFAEGAFEQVTYVPVCLEGGHGPCVEPSAWKTRWCEVPLSLYLSSAAKKSQARTRRSTKGESRSLHPLDAKAVTDKVHAHIDAQRPARLLATHRMLAIARASMSLRVAVLRRIVNAVPACDTLRHDLADYERARQKELLDELLALKSGDTGDRLERARAIVAELADAVWQEPLGGREIQHLQSALADIESSCSCRHHAIQAPQRRPPQSLAWALAVVAASVTAIMVAAGINSDDTRREARELKKAMVAERDGTFTVDDLRSQAGAIDAMIVENVLPVIGRFEQAAEEADRPHPRLRVLRTRASSELALVGERFHDLVETVQSRGADRGDELDEALSAIQSHYENASARYDRVIARRRDRDDTAIGALLDAAVAGGNQDAMEALSSAERLLRAVEDESGIRRDDLRARAQQVREAVDRQVAGRRASERVDQAIAKGIDAFLEAIDQEQGALARIQPKGEEAVAAVQATAGHYRSVVAWSEVATCWRPSGICTPAEADTWRKALHEARIIPVAGDTFGTDDRWSVVEDHLAACLEGEPRGLEAFREYLNLPIMREGVCRTVVDGRVSYFPSAVGRDVFVDERTLKSTGKDPPSSPMASGLLAAPHVAVARQLREVVQGVATGTTLVDEALIKSLRILGDVDLTKDVDPILLCRLDGDVMRLAARRPLFHPLSHDMLAIVEHLRSRLGDQPRWVRSVHWADADAWRSARRNAEDLKPSCRTLQRLADACEKSFYDLTAQPEYLCEVRPVGWVGAERGELVVRLAADSGMEFHGTILAVRRDAENRWRLAPVGDLGPGMSVRLFGETLLFAEPLFLASSEATK